MDVKRAIAGYLMLREKIDELEMAHKATVKELKEKQTKIANLVKKHFDETGEDSTKVTGVGTAFKAKKDSVRIDNKAEFTDFLMKQIEEHGVDGLYFATVSASKNAVKEYMADTDGELPPGVKYDAWVEVQFRSPTK